MSPPFPALAAGPQALASVLAVMGAPLYREDESRAGAEDATLIPLVLRHTTRSRDEAFPSPLLPNSCQIPSLLLKYRTYTAVRCCSGRRRKERRAWLVSIREGRRCSYCRFAEPTSQGREVLGRQREGNTYNNRCWGKHGCSRPLFAFCCLPAPSLSPSAILGLLSEPTEGALVLTLILAKVLPYTGDFASVPVKAAFESFATHAH